MHLGEILSFYMLFNLYSVHFLPLHIIDCGAHFTKFQHASCIHRHVDRFVSICKWIIHTGLRGHGQMMNFTSHEPSQILGATGNLGLLCHNADKLYIFRRNHKDYVKSTHKSHLQFKISNLCVNQNSLN